jgi:hypothetical protein
MASETYHHPTRREITNALFDRLRRVNAAAGTISALLRSRDASATALSDALEALEHDLVLAASEAERARARIKP